MNTKKSTQHHFGSCQLIPALVLGLAMLAPAAAFSADNATAAPIAPPPPSEPVVSAGANPAAAAQVTTTATTAADTKQEKSKGLTADLGPAGDVEITSDSMDMDFAKRISTFTGNVVVTEPRMTLKSEKVLVTFDAQQKPQIIVATGNVTINQPAANRQATGGKTEYDVVKGVIVLTEKPTLTSGEGTLSGAEKIIYYRDNERVVTEGGRPTITHATSPQKRGEPPHSATKQPQPEAGKTENK